MLTAQDRDTIRAEDYRACILLPFNEEQIAPTWPRQLSKIVIRRRKLEGRHAAALDRARRPGRC